MKKKNGKKYSNVKVEVIEIQYIIALIITSNFFKEGMIC